ncbi:MAG: M23 family metallopeptidase [Balneolaceae bacterium]
MIRLLFSFIIFAFIPFAAQAQQYIWPTDSGQFLSSTFGETRSAHFHAGLDIKTWGREGYQVFAARAGKVHRLLITERGYGKAVYLKHPDSTFTVYAHLQRFTPSLQAIADSIRMRDFSFEMEVNLDSLNLEVNQGDVIGFTGSSGIGPPHLHFEVRDSLENPVNALTTNLSVTDTQAPIFSSLIIEPLDIHTTIAGASTSATIAASPQENNRYDFGEMNISGKVGLAVDVYDIANRVPNKYAIYSLSLLHAGDTLFHQQLDTFSYDNDSEMFLDRIAPFGSPRRSHHRLYAKDGNKNPFNLKVLSASEIEPADTVKSYTIVATDYFGNASKAEISIKNKLSTINITPGLSNPTENWYWNENWASPDLISKIDLTAQNFGFPWAENQQLFYSDAEIPINFSRIIPGKSNLVKTPDQKLFIRFGKYSFFDTLTVAANYFIDENHIKISVEPEMLPSKTGFKIEFYLGEQYEEERNYQLFRVKKNNKLSYVDSRLIGKTIHAYPSSLGKFIIRPDDDPPLIDNFRLTKTDYGQWLGIATIKDELSGINSKTAEFWINDIRGIAEYDYEENLLTYYLPGFNPQASNTAFITVEDKAGNKTKINFEL